MRNPLRWLVAIAAFVAGATAAWTYTLQYTGTPGSGSFLRWASGTTVTMTYDLTFPAQFGVSNPNPSLVQAVLRNDMLNVWNGVLKSNNVPVQFADGGISSTVNAAGCNGVNLITFDNGNSAYAVPTGILALTWAFAYSAPAYPAVVPAGTCGPNAITITFAGQIVDADITFNPSLAFSTNGLYVGGSSLNQANDIEGTALHELGHVLGLHHATLNSALMIPSALQAFPNRSLSIDDIAGINADYGVNISGGSMSGKVTDSSGNPIFGAAVQLTDSNSGVPTVSQITDTNGNYSIVGFPASTYKIWVKPLDSPYTASANYSATEYATAPFPVIFNATAVTTLAVVTGNSNLLFPTIQVPTPHTATFQDVAVQTTTTASTGTLMSAVAASVASARRAGNPASSYPASLGSVTGSYTICALGTGLTGTLTTSVPTAQASGSTIQSNTSCNFASAGLAQNFTFPANTVPGFYDVYTGNDIMPSSLQITTNPLVPAGGIVDAAANTKTYAAGAFISIYGLDLTTQTIGNTVFPVPTQLGGVSVRVGDRFAPLFFVSPGQVNAMIPYEAISCSTGATTGCAVDVQVQVGSNSVFDYGNITVVASAPKMFSINSTGSGQGAIQDGSAPSCPAACPIADGTHYTASAGDVLVIYASGLGQTTPAAIDGLAGTGTTAAATASITANGTTLNAPVVYTGVTSCCAALYQVNATVPAGLGVSNAAQVQITDSLGNKSNIVTIAIH
jgi:uncharacterized protein (TIGR03437 family)